MYGERPGVYRYRGCWGPPYIADRGLQRGGRIHHVCGRKRAEKELLVLCRDHAKLGWHVATSLSSDLSVNISEWCNSTTQLHAFSCTHPAHAYDNAPVSVLLCANTSTRLCQRMPSSGIVCSYLFLSVIARDIWARLDSYDSSGAIVVSRARLPLRPREDFLVHHCCDARTRQPLRRLQKRKH
jgi:hypothetical protein